MDLWHAYWINGSWPGNGGSRNQQMGLICMNGVLVVFVPLRVVGNISSYNARTVLKDQAKSQTLEVAKGLGPWLIWPCRNS